MKFIRQGFKRIQIRTKVALNLKKKEKAHKAQFIERWRKKKSLWVFSPRQKGSFYQCITCRFNLLFLTTSITIVKFNLHAPVRDCYASVSTSIKHTLPGTWKFGSLLHLTGTQIHKAGNYVTRLAQRWCLLTLKPSLKHVLSATYIKWCL